MRKKQRKLTKMFYSLSSDNDAANAELEKNAIFKLKRMNADIMSKLVLNSEMPFKHVLIVSLVYFRYTQDIVQKLSTIELYIFALVYLHFVITFLSA